ncbi:hypothetical protein K402DRAFT_392833, partial [Aulographum hederae CBS 113979]
MNPTRSSRHFKTTQNASAQTTRSRYALESSKTQQKIRVSTIVQLHPRLLHLFLSLVVGTVRAILCFRDSVMAPRNFSMSSGRSISPFDIFSSIRAVNLGGLA